ncbi:hypothetical protein B0H16DRAFT_1733694 [Mycena metata]|uniref:Uncharacterized protein n=1 Tax=Mycena metata TaxID=1033252 RepID=A0AAD7MSC0_9AGAR|nr:hypothetical protein B0H16DRAFT_1733694 [Mycena metata]
MTHPTHRLKELKDTLETSRSASTSRHRARISGAASRATPGTHARRTRSSSGAVPAARSSHSSARLRRNAFGRQRAALDRGTVPTLPVGAGTRHSPHHLGTASSKEQGRQGSARPRMSRTAVSRMCLSAILDSPAVFDLPRLIVPVSPKAWWRHFSKKYATLSPGRWKRRTTMIMLLNCVAVYPFPLRARHSVSYIPLFTPLDAQGRVLATQVLEDAVIGLGTSWIYVSKQQKSGALAQGGIGDTGLAPAVDLG